MGEHQCQECGHITTGFEKQDWLAARNALIEECAKAAENADNPHASADHTSSAAAQRIRRLLQP